MSSVYESVVIDHRPGDNTGVGVVDITLDRNGVVVNTPARIKQGSSIIYEKEVLSMLLDLTVASSIFSQVLWIVPEGRWQLAGVRTYVQTGSTSGTFNVEVATGSTGLGSGTAQLTGTVSLAAAVQQVTQIGTLIASPTVMGPGDRLNALIAGTLTSLAGGMAQVELVRIS